MQRSQSAAWSDLEDGTATSGGQLAPPSTVVPYKFPSVPWISAAEGNSPICAVETEQRSESRAGVGADIALRRDQGSWSSKPIVLLTLKKFQIFSLRNLVSLLKNKTSGIRPVATATIAKLTGRVSWHVQGVSKYYFYSLLNSIISGPSGRSLKNCGRDLNYSFAPALRNLVLFPTAQKLLIVPRVTDRWAPHSTTRWGSTWKGTLLKNRPLGVIT